MWFTLKVRLNVVISPELCFHIDTKITEEIKAYLCYFISSIFCIPTLLKYVTKTPGSSIYYNRKDFRITVSF